MESSIDLTRESQPLAAFRDHSSEFMAHLKETHRPITLTVDGKPEAVLQEASAYQRLLDLAAAADANEGIRQGLDELARDESRPAREFLEEMRQKYAIPR